MRAELQLRKAGLFCLCAAWAVAAQMAAFAGGQIHGNTPRAGGADTSFEAVAAQANAARDADRLDAAVPLFRKALSLNPKWAEGWWSLGTIYYDGDQYAQAALAFEKLVALDAHRGTARAMLGLCQFELGNDAEALRNLEASKQLGTVDDPELRQVALFHLGTLLRRAGRFEGAEDALGSLCVAGVANREARQALGMAVLRISETTPPAPGSSAARVVELLGRGACLSAQKNYDAARREYEAAEAIDPRFPYLHYAFGRFLLDARDTATAIRQLQQEIELSPQSVVARVRIAVAEYKVDSAAGLPYAGEAVKLAPQMPFAHYVLGLLLLDTGGYENAIPELEIARKAFPNEARIALSLGSAYTHVGRPEDAARARAEFVRLSQASASNPAAANAEPSPNGAPRIEINGALDAAPRQ